MALEKHAIHTVRHTSITHTIAVEQVQQSRPASPQVLPRGLQARLLVRLYLRFLISSSLSLLILL